MLWSVASVLLEKDSDKSVLEDVLRRIGRTSSQRNKYIHDTWGVAQTQKHEIFQMRAPKTGPNRIMDQVTLPDMKAAIDQINKLAEELDSFRKRIIPSLPALLEKYRKLPSLGLAYAPKGHPPGRKPKGFHGQRRS